MLHLAKLQDKIIAAFHIQEAATEVGVAMLVLCIDEQYHVDLDERYVGYRNQKPLTIIVHLTKTWVKVQNHEKLACMDAFTFEWAKSPGMHIKTFALELTKRQGVMTKLGIPCKDALKVMTYLTNMYKYGIFNDIEMIHWENTPALQKLLDITQ